MTYDRKQSIGLDEAVLAEIKQQLAQIKFGSLEISVHNGQIVQLERRKKSVGEKAKILNNQQ